MKTMTLFSTLLMLSSAVAQSTEGLVDPGMLGINIDPTNSAARPPPTADELNTLGASRVRVEFKAPNGLDNAFATYDPWINQYTARGISTLLVIDYQSQPGFVSGAPDFLSNYAPQFVARAGDIARHYATLRSNIAAYEIWNEEDLPCLPDYCPAIPNPIEYAQLLSPAANAVNAASPGTAVVMGGLAGSDDNYLATVINTMGPDWATIDAVGIHPYGYWPSDEGDHGRQSMPAALAATDTGGKPIWLTEHGDEDLSTQVEYVSTFLSYFNAHPGLISQAFLFAWSDAMRSGHPFGVYDSSGGRKPSWGAFHGVAVPPVIDREIICRDVQNCEATEIVERPMTISRSGGVFYAGVRARIAPGHTCAFRLDEFLGYNCGIFGQSFTSGSYTEGGIIVPFTVDPAPYPVDQYSGRLVSLCDNTATPCINANLIP